jgi:hypothetical protein
MLNTLLKHKRKFLIVLLGMVFGHSFAQYEIRKYTINNGGGKSSGGDYSLNASIGQVDASAPKSGGGYTLNAGFWQENNDLIFKNGFE